MTDRTHVYIADDILNLERAFTELGGSFLTLKTAVQYVRLKAKALSGNHCVILPFAIVSYLLKKMGCTFE